MAKHIAPRDKRLLAAVAALIVLAVATTTPTGGGMSCCGKEEPDITATFINNHTENEGLGIAPNIVVVIVDTKPKSGIKTIKEPMKVGNTVTKVLPGGGTYFYTVLELDLLTPGKCIDSGFIIADATVTVD